MRILVISNFLPPRMMGGFELACYNISKGLRARGHEVLILTTPTEKELPEPQPFVDRSLAMSWFPTVPIKSTTIRRFFRHEALVSQQSNSQIVLSRIRSFRPDHILMFNLVGIGGLGIVDLIESTGVPWTMNLGDRVPTALVEDVPAPIRAIYGADDTGNLFGRGRYAAVSQTLVDEIEREGISIGDDVTIIPRGVVIADVPRTRPYRENGVTRFVSAGILRPHKGIDLILEAVKVVDDRDEFDFFVDIYGGGPRDKYEAVAEKLGILHRVTFRGPVTQREVIEANAGADAFLFPTWEREPGASAPVEAGVAGAVPIMTGDCGPAERMVDGVHCIKIERSVSSLASAMSAVGRGEVDLEAIGRAGRRLAAGDLSFPVSIRRLEAVLERGGTPDYTNIEDRELDRDLVAKDEQATGLLYNELGRR